MLLALLDHLRRAQGMYLVLLISLVGIGGIVVIALIMSSWRRFNRRNAFTRRQEPMPDLWQAGGDRLGSQIDNGRGRDLDEPRPPPPPAGPTPPAP